MESPAVTEMAAQPWFSITIVIASLPVFPENNTRSIYLLREHKASVEWDVEPCMLVQCSRKRGHGIRSQLFALLRGSPRSVHCSWLSWGPLVRILVVPSAPQHLWRYRKVCSLFKWRSVQRVKLCVEVTMRDNMLRYARDRNVLL